MANSRLIDFIYTSRNAVPLDIWARKVALPTAAWTDVVTYSFPTAMEGVILGVGVDVENVEAFNNVDFRFLKGSSVINGLDLLMPRSECLARPIEFAIPAFIEAGKIIHLQARSASAPSVTHYVWARVIGGRWQQLSDYQFARLLGVPLTSLSPEDQSRYAQLMCWGNPLR